MCNKCLEKIKDFLKDHRCQIPPYLSLIFGSMNEGTGNVVKCHACFLKRFYKQNRAFNFKTMDYRGPRYSHPPYHGHLLFKEFGLIVDSNTIDIVGHTSVDVHGLGAERGHPASPDGKKRSTSGTKAPFHMVIDLETAKYLDDGVWATDIDECFSHTKCKPHLQGRFHRQYLRRIKLSNYVPEMVPKEGGASPEEKLRSWNIEIIKIKELRDSHGWGYSESRQPQLQIRKGDTEVTREELENFVLFDHRHKKTLPNGKPLHVTFVLGEFKGKNVQSLLVARFYNQYKKCPTPSEVHAFFNSLINMTENDGRERSRFGGSLGTFFRDRHRMLDCMSESGLSPRKRSGTLILPNPIDFEVVYLSPKGVVKKWKYSIPRHGGKLKMAMFTPDFLQNFEKILLPFVECKIWTAHLLRDIHALKSVVPRAMKTELENIDRSLDSAKSVFRLQDIDPDIFRESFRFEVLFRYSKLNRWSLNC